MRLWLPIFLLLGLAACASDQDARYQFGVSADRAASSAMDPDTQAALDRKANQICTQGYQTVKVDIMKAEQGRQIADLDLQCNQYQTDLWPSSFSLSNLF